ncbi:putative NADH-flavin reductase [Catenulispora sp. MAP12-49]
MQTVRPPRKAGRLAVAVDQFSTVPGVELLRADLLHDGSDRALERLLADSDVVVNAAGSGWRGTLEQMLDAYAVLVERLLRLIPPHIRLVQLGTVHE